jgi:hypothetical protein
MASACYVYAIVGRDTPLPAPGSGGAAELTLVRWRGLAAVMGRMAYEDARVSMEAVLQHEAVVEAVRQQGPALPVRFGTLFRDATAVVSALVERYDPLVADLDRLGDKVELSVTALWAAPPADSDSIADAAAGSSAGGRYLRARAAELRRDDAMRTRARGVAGELDEVLGKLSLERRVSLLPTPRVAVRTAWLLEPGQVAAFRSAFASIRQRELRLLLTGPWPPYSFVRPAAADGGNGTEGRLAALARLMTDAMQERGG